MQGQQGSSEPDTIIYNKTRKSYVSAVVFQWSGYNDTSFFLSALLLLRPIYTER